MTVDPQARPWATLDGPTLVQAAAALQLLPENRPAFLRLQRLAVVAAGLPTRENAARLSPSGLRQALQHPVVTEVIANEDPPEDLYTCEVPFHGGPHLAIEGLSTDSGYVVGLLLRAIFAPKEECLMPKEYVHEASLLTTALLRVSDLVCRRVGLRRGQSPGTDMRTKIFVPGRDALQQLMEAVLLTPEDLAGLLPAAAIRFVQDLVLARRSDESPSIAPDESALVVRPFLSMAENILVSNPGELSGSLRHNLIVLAQHHRCQAQLAEAFRQEVARQAASVLRLFGMRSLASIETTSDPLVLRQRFEFADDKYLDLAIVTDDLADYAADDPYGMWRVPDLGRRVQDIVDRTEATGSEEANTLRVILQQPLGRGYALGLTASRREGPIMTATLSELEVIATLDGDDPLALWRFAQADSELHKVTRVLSFSALDNYGLYRGHDYSYYLSDDRKPDLLNISSDHALPLKIEANRKAGFREVLSPHRPVYIQVVSIHGTDKAPIYAVHPRHVEDETLVDFGDLHVWVGVGDQSDNLRGFGNDIAEAAAYWIWQLSVAIPGFLQGSTFKGRLYVELVPDDAEAWSGVLSGQPGNTNEEDPWVSAGDSTLGKATLLLRASGARSLLSEKNNPDRLLVSALAIALADATGVSLKDVSAITDRVAPFGRKKIIRVTTGTNILLRPPRFRSGRLVQPAVTSKIVDEMGVQLAAGGLKEGQVPDAERNDVLKKCVDYYFQRIQATALDLTPDGLIEYLINRDESLLYGDAVERDSLAYRIACFGESPDLTQEIARNERKRTEAAIASRFLIEYVAATPPSGSKKITLDIYDHLLAAAAEIYSRAILSDAIHHNFSEAKLTLLASGRLGSSRGDRYESGTSVFSAAQAEAVRLMALGAESASKDARQEPVPPSPAVESGMLAEFGFTLAELGAGIGTLINLGDERRTEEPCRVPKVAAERHLRDNLGWDEEKVAKFIGGLSLRPRKSFLSVGTDAFPWRYNREWSYLRRPLVQVRGAGGGDDLVWGPRRLWSAGGYWINLIYSGRMRAKSPELKRAVSTIRQEENHAFEQSVADALARGGCSIATAGLVKVCGKKLQSGTGDDLGDIDALGIHLGRRIVFVGEAKDFELARTPSELAHEADHLLYDERSALRKLRGRSDWVKQNLSSIIKHFKLDMDTSGWTVLPVIVTSRNLVSPHVLSSDVPVIAIDKVEGFVQGAVSRARARRTNRKGGTRKR